MSCGWTDAAAGSLKLWERSDPSTRTTPANSREAKVGRWGVLWNPAKAGGASGSPKPANCTEVEGSRPEPQQPGLSVTFRHGNHPPPQTADHASASPTRRAEAAKTR